MGTPQRPESLPINETLEWRILRELRLKVDVYLPKGIHTDKISRFVVYFHGGAWINGNRGDYCRPAFQEFLDLGFAILSPDYRLLPESTYQEQLDDVLATEKFREYFPKQAQVIVYGVSAGALLAINTVRLWSRLPDAIVLGYGPSDLRKMWFKMANHSKITELARLCEKGRFSKPVGETPLDLEGARTDFARLLVREGGITNCMLGNPQYIESCLVMEIDQESVAEINPVQFLLNPGIKCPPVYQYVGDADQIFDLSHARELERVLNEKGVINKLCILPGKGHAYDVFESGPVDHQAPTWSVAILSRLADENLGCIRKDD